jgi:hypothetical protein
MSGAIVAIQAPLGKSRIKRASAAPPFPEQNPAEHDKRDSQPRAPGRELIRYEPAIAESGDEVCYSQPTIRNTSTRNSPTMGSNNSWNAP